MARSLLLLLVLFLTADLAWAGGGPWSVPVTVSAPRDTAPAAVRLEAEWLGQTQVLDLEPAPGRAGELRFTGTLHGQPLRLLNLRIYVAEGSVTLAEGSAWGGPWYENLEVLRRGPTDRVEPLHYAVDPERPGIVRRVARAGTVAWNMAATRWEVGAHLAWATGVLLVLGLALRRGRRGPIDPRAPSAAEEHSEDPEGTAPCWPRWADPLAWLLIALVLTWPAALAGPERLVGRFFDLPGTLWSIASTSRLVAEGFSDPLTAFPEGADYRAFDSYTLIPLSLLSGVLGPSRFHGFAQILGVWSSGWAATALARALGARGAWALLGGLGFAASGIAAAALLEGHVYYLLDPWLPLMLWAWWRATRPEGTARDGLLAGLTFSAALLTTGYLGVVALVPLVVFGLDGLRRRGAAFLGPTAAALAGALPAVGLVSAGVLAHAGASPVQPDAIAQSAVDLVRLSGPTAELDRVSHGLAPHLPATLLALAALAPRVLGGRRGKALPWRPLALTALLALALSFGPRLGASSLEGLGPSPLAWLWELPGAALLRFPARFAWAWSLCLGMLAALVASRARLGRAGALLLWGAVAVDVFVISGLPARRASMAGGPVAAMVAGDGPVLELLPEGTDHSGETDAWLSALSCYRQVFHQAAIGDDCVRVPVSDSPRFEVARAVKVRLLEGDAWGAAEVAEAEGYARLAWQPDHFHPAARARLAAALARLPTAPTESRTGGVFTQVYELPGDAGAGEALTRVASRDEEEGPRRGFLSRPGTHPEAGGPELARLELVLRAPRDLPPPHSVTATLQDATGRARDALLSRRAESPGDWDGDEAWRATWEEPGPGPHVLRLESEGSELWSGELLAAQAADRVDLSLERDAAGALRAEPLVLAPEGHALGLRSGEGVVALGGWCAWLVVFVGLQLVGRQRAGWRRRPSRPARSGR